MGRTIAATLAPRLGQPVMVRNMPGAGTTVAAQALRRAAPDGCTLMLSGSTSLSVAPVPCPRPNIDRVRDFTRLCTLAKSPFVLLGRRGGPAALAARRSR
jgi:tripartite-type tricarboxylate transporter receptor subunit TctC